MYINVLSIPINDSSSTPGCIPCIVDLADSRVEFDAMRLEGGQRFRVPSAAMDMILDHLFAGGMLDLQIGRYKGQITACNFKQAYKKLF